MPTRSRLLSLAAPALVAGLALSGCSVSDEEVLPGAAASVDGTTIPLSEIDETTRVTCQYYDDNPAPDSAIPAYPLVTVRSQVVQTRLLEIAAKSLVDELDPRFRASYEDDVARIQEAYADLPDDEAQTLIDGDLASNYVVTAGLSLGDELLRAESGSEPTDDSLSFQRGLAAMQQWLTEHDVEINPVYGLRLDDTGTFVGDPGLSQPESDEATAAQDVVDLNLYTLDQAGVDELNAAAAGLPGDEVCGA